MATTFSIILPLYKQESHAELLYKTYVEQLDSLEESWELLFIVNGVDDGAIEKLHNLNSRPNVKILWLEKGGWGRAVKYGMAQAEGKYLCYTNSARTDIEDLIMILKYAKVNDDTVLYFQPPLLFLMRL